MLFTLVCRGKGGVYIGDASWGRPGNLGILLAFLIIRKRDLNGQAGCIMTII